MSLHCELLSFVLEFILPEYIGRLGWTELLDPAAVPGPAGPAAVPGPEVHGTEVTLINIPTDAKAPLTDLPASTNTALVDLPTSQRAPRLAVPR